MGETISKFDGSQGKGHGQAGVEGAGSPQPSEQAPSQQNRASSLRKEEPAAAQQSAHAQVPLPRASSSSAAAGPSSSAAQHSGFQQGSSSRSPSLEEGAPLCRSITPAREPDNQGQSKPAPLSNRVPSRQRSQLSVLTNDGDSDWDQCSNYDPETHAPPSCKARQPGPASPDQSLPEEDTPSAASHAEEDNDEYRETLKLWIEKVGGCMFVNQYLVVKFLGRGACGKVFLCLNTQDLRLYAMKAVRKVDIEGTHQEQSSQHKQQPSKPKRNPMEDLKREIMIMKRMKHPNIVLLKEVIDDPTSSKLLLVMEYVEGGPVLTRDSLEKRDKLPESIARQYFRDMVKALDYLHCHKVVHGDLKPENVLMSASGDVKLSDFGCSKVFATGNEYLERCNGTPAFLAPEMMKPNTRYRGRPTDVYALGACLYTLVFGRIPFSAPNLYKLFQVVQHEPVRYPSDVPISTSLRHLLDSMLTKDPHQRITLAELMRHPWGTLNGKFPLKSTRGLKPGETQEQHAGVQSEATFAQCHPRPDFLAGLAEFSSSEHTFNEGDYIMKQGEAGTYMVYILSGTVDVLMRWASPRPRAGCSRASGSHEEGAGEEGGSEVALEPLSSDAQRRNREALTNASQRACQFMGSLKEAGNTPRGDLLVAQKGAGELLGEMSLFSKSISRCASIRCVSKVDVRIITHEQLVDYLMQQPMAKHQIRESIWKKECEITMVEALVKLASMHDALDASLKAPNVSPPQPSSRTGHMSPGLACSSPSTSGFHGPAHACPTPPWTLSTPPTTHTHPPTPHTCHPLPTTSFPMPTPGMHSAPTPSVSLPPTMITPTPAFSIAPTPLPHPASMSAMPHAHPQPAFHLTHAHGPRSATSPQPMLPAMCTVGQSSPHAHAHPYPPHLLPPSGTAAVLGSPGTHTAAHAQALQQLTNSHPLTSPTGAPLGNGPPVFRSVSGPSGPVYQRLPMGPPVTKMASTSSIRQPPTPAPTPQAHSGVLPSPKAASLVAATAAGGHNGTSGAATAPIVGARAAQPHVTQPHVTQPHVAQPHSGGDNKWAGMAREAQASYEAGVLDLSTHPQPHARVAMGYSGYPHPHAPLTHPHAHTIAGSAPLPAEMAHSLKPHTTGATHTPHASSAPSPPPIWTTHGHSQAGSRSGSGYNNPTHPHAAALMGGHAPAPHAHAHAHAHAGMPVSAGMVHPSAVHPSSASAPLHAKSGVAAGAGAVAMQLGAGGSGGLVFVPHPHPASPVGYAPPPPHAAMPHSGSSGFSSALPSSRPSSGYNGPAYTQHSSGGMSTAVPSRPSSGYNAPPYTQHGSGAASVPPPLSRPSSGYNGPPFAHHASAGTAPSSPGGASVLANMSSSSSTGLPSHTHVHGHGHAHLPHAHTQPHAGAGAHRASSSSSCSSSFAVRPSGSSGGDGSMGVSVLPSPRQMLQQQQQQRKSQDAGRVGGGAPAAFSDVPLPLVRLGSAAKAELEAKAHAGVQ